MALKPKQLRNALASIIDKETKKDLVTAGMIKDIQTNRFQRWELVAEGKEWFFSIKNQQITKCLVKTTGGISLEACSKNSSTWFSRTHDQEEKEINSSMLTS